MVLRSRDLRSRKRDVHESAVLCVCVCNQLVDGVLHTSATIRKENWTVLSVVEKRAVRGGKSKGCFVPET